jgi:energy-coupling factor transporter ATP-binding protein EcfA2
MATKPKHAVASASDEMQFPLRHLSLRVPWHDAVWAGLVCHAPRLNTACVKLKGIAARKNEAALESIAGRSLEDLPNPQWPPCVDERATFMAPFEMDQVRRHALAALDPQHYGHFKPTSQRYPAFSAGVVPFRWMMRENMEKYADQYALDVDSEREPDLGYETSWIHEAENQAALLNAFAAHLREKESLYLVYAKHVPFVEGTTRVLIGAGRITAIGTLKEYEYSKAGLRGMVWERPIQHSIRPKTGDGFLFPYEALLERALQEPLLDIETFAPKVPDEQWDEFSYGSELVTHDGAIGALLSLESSLSRIENELGVLTLSERTWINDELTRLWRVRGPFPGLGAVLAAFGVSRGIFVAHSLQEKAGPSKDPWPLVDESFRNGGKTLPPTLRADFPHLAAAWNGLSDERRQFLKLLSRIQLTTEQANALYEEGSRKKNGWGSTDREIIENPFRFYELTRHEITGVGLLTVDRGVFPDDALRLQHPLTAPSALESAIDLRRVRAFTISTLEDAAAAGHTLLPRDLAVQKISERAVRPALPITGDILAASVGRMQPEVVATPADKVIAVQLSRYKEIGDLTRKNVDGRIVGKRNDLARPWIHLLDEKFGPANTKEEKLAREEKAAALKEIAEARFSVLAGPAGAGKTTILSILCGLPEIHAEGVLLLAPTGKARVRMQELAGGGATKALTIAQFLNQHGRYENSTGRYVLSNQPKATGFSTVIIDESSMLTEDMLGALFDGLQGVKRFVLVGDPSQLPPIGAGRPFADIIARLRPANYESIFPRVGTGYAELTIERRQVGTDRPDLRLARWFSGARPAPAEDDVFFNEADGHPHLSFLEWKDGDDFDEKLASLLTRELCLTDAADSRGFNKALGCTPQGQYDYFNKTSGDKRGAVAATGAWQILSPIRGMPFGVSGINRQIHERFRRDTLEFANRHPRSIPKPMGAERIVYGDKVINLRNHRRDGNKVWPKEGALGYLANGEIGIVTGQWKSFASPKILHVEFSSQEGFTYSFFKSDFREESEPMLELAYALTVHKAQGSQFELVILVLPESHPILSRELIYTALTRHQRRIVVMHQGPKTLLKELAAPHRSETARRMTNLMRPCEMVEVPIANGSVFLQQGLVHRTSRGLAVRSKSEVIIAEALAHAGVSFEYEKPLTLGGSTRYPDFTIEDEISGQTVYWEHLGLLEREDYREGWKKKLSWYRQNGVLPKEEGTGAKGTLIMTKESSQTGLDVAVIQQHIKTLA